MTHRQLAAGVLAVALAATPGAALAKDKPNRSKLFQNKANTVTCGIKIAIPGHPHAVLCSAAGIPKAKTGIGDPFVQIGRTGKPRLVLVSQNEFQTDHATTLGTGSSWGRAGVVCTVAGKKVTCTNQAAHGFTIGNGKYKPF